MNGCGAKRLGISLETREIKPFWRDIPGFCRDIPGVPEKFKKKEFVFNSRPLIAASKHHLGDIPFVGPHKCLWALFSLINSGATLPKYLLERDLCERVCLVSLSKELAWFSGVLYVWLYDVFLLRLVGTQNPW